NFVCKKNWSRHERVLLVNFALGASEAKHHALVTSAFLFATPFFLGIDAHGDIGRLTVQQYLDVRAIEGETILVVTDIFYDIARNICDHLAIHDGLVAMLLKERRLPAAFPSDDDLVCGR